MFLGVDLGTSSLKILLSDENGVIFDRESAEYPVLYPREGWSEQNPEDWYHALVSVLCALGGRNDLSCVDGVSFCGQMHGLVLLDENDAVLRPALLWNDGRTVEETAFLNDRVGREQLLSWTGNIALTGFTAPKLLWVRKREPELFAQIRKIMLPKDYLVYRMSGAFASDVSDCSGTLYFDTAHKCWSAPMLELLGIGEEQLPRVYESSCAVGMVCPDFAARTGLSAAARVIVGGGDQAVGAVGAGAVEEGVISISLGTSGVVFAAADRFASVEDGRLHSFCHATGGYHVMGVILSAAAALRWWVEDVLGRRDFDAVLDEVDPAMMDDLLFLPYLMGERSPINDPFAKGAFYGLNLQKGRAQMTKAVLEGVSFALRDCYDAVLHSGVRPAFARVIGGGARSGAWLQILADVLGLEVRTTDVADGGAMGAVMLAMVGCGRYETVLEASRAYVHDRARYLPDPERYARYSEKFCRYRELYQRTKGL